MGRVLFMRQGIRKSEERFRKSLNLNPNQCMPGTKYVAPIEQGGDLSLLEMEERHKQRSSNETYTTYAFNANSTPSEPYLKMDNGEVHHNSHQVTKNHQNGGHLDSQISDMKDSVNYLRKRFTDRHHVDVHHRVIQRHWRDVALIFDRFFFVLYLMLIIVSLIFLFPRPK